MSIKNQFSNYWSLQDQERASLLKDAYNNQKMSWIQIATELNTYPNKVRREAKRLGIQSRTKSVAQKEALKGGRSLHPTEGKKLHENTKLKISESQGVVWDGLSEKERTKRSEAGKNSWNKKTEKEKQEVIRKGGDAIREASRIGSKLERFLLEALTKRNYRVQFHKEHWLKNQRLETDLFVEDLRTAIEVDGPSHFSPVWGEKNLTKSQQTDLEKTGLILGQGLVLIRIRQTKRISQRYLRKILEDLLNILDQISKEFPKENKRYIEL
jgi:very-short-patch-repair endonuclease